MIRSVLNPLCWLRIRNLSFYSDFLRPVRFHLQGQPNSSKIIRVSVLISVRFRTPQKLKMERVQADQSLDVFAVAYFAAAHAETLSMNRQHWEMNGFIHAKNGM